MQRRELIKALGLSAGGLLLPFGRSGWAAADLGNSQGKRLIVVMLRGAVDGLSVVVPYSEREYYQARSSIALPPPGGDGGVLDLDGHFGLHPALAPLMPLWQQKKLAFVHAAGSPDPTRSHFDAQDYIESGTPGRKSTSDGWMNRLLTQLPGPHAPTQAISLGPVQPRILSGRANVANVPLGRNAGKDIALDHPAVGAIFDKLYAGDDALSQAYQNGRDARSEIQANFNSISDAAREMKAADNGAPPASGFALDAQQLSELMQNDAHIELAFAALGGWDTHVRQGNAKGQLAGHLQALGMGLSALTQGLGPDLDNTVIMVISEFGRTVHENGNGGTDHGHGNVIWLVGGDVQGGKVHGEWPTLESSALYQNRDLAVTSDYRAVIAQLMERHLRLGDAQLAAILPEAPKSTASLSRLFAA
jgi:uncharacterized protein (DUF1501 family)